MGLIEISQEPQVSYHMDERLKRNIEQNIKGILKKEDSDYVLVVDGREGSGKSTLAFQIGRYVDPSLDLSRVCFTAEEFTKAINTSKPNQCVIYDEAITGLSSRASMSKVNKLLVSLMCQMRAKNLFVIVILPTFYMLDRYVAIFRAEALIHVFRHKKKRGFFVVYNNQKKKRLYLRNKATFTYGNVFSPFRGRFYGKFALGDDSVKKKYDKLKDDALQDYGGDEKEAQSKYMIQRNKLLKILYDNYLKSAPKMSKLLIDNGIELKARRINIILQELYGEHGKSTIA